MVSLMAAVGRSPSVFADACDGQPADHVVKLYDTGGAGGRVPLRCGYQDPNEPLFGYGLRHIEARHGPIDQRMASLIAEAIRKGVETISGDRHEHRRDLKPGTFFVLTSTRPIDRLGEVIGVITAYRLD